MPHTNSLDFTLIPDRHLNGRCARKRVAVIWIDWYSYHVARFRALAEHPLLEGNVVGIELVGGAGVHGDLVFRDAEREGLPITTLDPDRGWTEAGQYRLARMLWAKLAELDPDVVLIPGCYMLPGLAATLWASYRRRTAILMSESTLQDHPRNPHRESLKGAVLTRLYHAAIGGGVRQLAYLRNLGFRENQIARLYDVVDNEYFEHQVDDCRRRTTARALNLPPSYFLYVGRLAPEKNIDGLIRGFARYRRAGGTWSLVLVGDGPDAQSLKELARSEGVLDHVDLAGLKSTREIVFYYAFASCFVLPSLREPWGLVVNEAMAAGLPLILSDRCGCCDDLLDQDRNGYGFDPGQLEQLTLALEKVTHLGEEQRWLMGRRSREIVSRYSPPLWAEEVVRIAGLGLVSSHSVA